MPENYEVRYTHSSGATATFIRQDGELDALAKGLDAEQFWVFKNVKSLLVRNDDGDLDESNRLMAGIGFRSDVRVITSPEQVAARPVLATAGAAEHAHTGPHLPGPSYNPLFLAASVLLAFVGLLFMDTTLLITAVGLALAFVFMIRWGLEPL